MNIKRNNKRIIKTKYNGFIIYKVEERFFLSNISEVVFEIMSYTVNVKI